MRREPFNFVMPRLAPGIHVFLESGSKTWMAGKIPAMTLQVL
jgi:hypothetical protein